MYSTKRVRYNNLSKGALDNISRFIFFLAILPIMLRMTVNLQIQKENTHIHLES